MSIEEQHIEQIPPQQPLPTPSSLPESSLSPASPASFADETAATPVDKPVDEDHTESPDTSTTTPPQSKDWHSLVRRGLQSGLQRGIQGLRSPLWLCLLAALLVRIWLVVHTNGVID